MLHLETKEVAGLLDLRFPPGWGSPSHCRPNFVPSSLSLAISLASICVLFNRPLVENGYLVQHPNAICPDLAGQWGPMTGLGPGSCRLEVDPGSFQSIGPGFVASTGTNAPRVARGALRSIGPGSYHEPGSKTLPWL
jgi:hypothetical protein